MNSERREELDALLVRRATVGLDPEEIRRLNELLAEHPDVDPEWVDRVVGELDAETAAASEAPLSFELHEALIAAGPQALPARSDRSLRRRLSPASWGGWALAAALAGLFFAQQVRTSTAPSFGTVASAADAILVEWSPGADATGAEASGEIVWSGDAQTGVMRFRGLAPNPPSEFQYQLWIFDEDRDDRYPVDGGVFDVPGGTMEAEVPIRAKLDVAEPTLFAVTVERPGGVVVSSRERIATLAQVAD